jgi:hypothetical protein
MNVIFSDYSLLYTQLPHMLLTFKLCRKIQVFQVKKLYQAQAIAG